MVQRILPQDYFTRGRKAETPKIVPKAEYRYVPVQPYQTEETDKTLIFLGLMALGFVALVCITAIVVTRK